MAKILKRLPGETIGIPLELRQEILPLLSDSLRQRAHVYNHPRELLINCATSHAVYLTNAELVLHRGIPAKSAEGVIYMTPPGTLQPAKAWQMFVRRWSQGPS
jgi:hypothetical protein